MFGNRKVWKIAEFTIVIIIVFLFAESRQHLQAEEPLKIGVLTDITGPAGVLCGTDPDAVRMAIHDFGGEWAGKKIEMIVRDMKGQVALAVEMAEELYEHRKADVILGAPWSSVAIAVSKVALSYKKPLIIGSAYTSQLIEDKCNRYTFLWGFNNYAYSASLADWMTKQIKGRRIYTFTQDYAAGHTMLRNYLEHLRPGKFLHTGNSMIPRGTKDFSQYFLDALKTKPDALLNITVVVDQMMVAKQAKEIGLKKMGIPVLHGSVTFEFIVKSATSAFAGDRFVTPWYWKHNMSNPESADFISTWKKEFQRPPYYVQAMMYSGARQYLNAVKRAGSKDSHKVIKALEGHTFKDIFGNSEIYAENHQKVSDLHIVQVKVPGPKDDAWDFFDLVGTIPFTKAFRDPKTTGCKIGGF